jgi:FKBP-type peptidyl-prolyl cis-trans isomerase
MKNLFYLIPVLALFWACNGGGSASGGMTTLNDFTDSASYAQGLMMAQQLKEYQAEGEAPILNPNAMAAGLEVGFSGGEAMFTDEEIRPILTKWQMGLQKVAMEKAQAAGAVNRQKGAAFLAENADKEGVETTESGLQYIVEDAGSGASPTATDKVQVNYEGRLIDGTVFDSSYKRGEPAEFGVGQVIPGWTEGLQLMKEGAKYQFFIPADLAYGDQAPPDIGPGQVLIFNVELLKVNP